MSKLKKDVQLTLLSRVPVMVLSFLSVIFLTRLLGPEGNGVYTFSMAALNLFFVLIGFQLEGTLPVFLAKEKENTPGIFSAIAMLSISSFLVFIILLTAIVFVIPDGIRFVISPGQPVIFFFLFLVIAFILRRISTLIFAVLRGCFKFKAYNVYMILSQLIPSIVYGLLFWMSVRGTIDLSMQACFQIILLLELILVLIGLYMIRKARIVKFSRDYQKFIGPITSLSTKTMLSSAGHFLNKRLDVWFVQFYNGTAMVGQYGLATQIANFISEAMTPFNQVLTPYIAEATPEEHKEIVERTARLNLTIALTAAVLIIGTSWIFIPLFFGKAFVYAIPATQILALGIIFISQRLVFIGYFKAINQMKHAIQAAWTGVVITILLDILLIPTYGIIGAAWATTIAYGTTVIFLMIIAKRKLGFQWTSVLMVRKSDIKWLLSKTSKDGVT
ncbi:MAG TPA: oligosaccharide flippase family protein [Saprospiraceae bacterium]